MPEIRYEPWAPGDAALTIVAQANAICAEYAAQGYDLTLRQLYYQFVARGLIANTTRDYKRLGDIVNRARMAGLLDWDYIVDRTRNLEALAHFAGPANVLEAARQSYRIDRWQNQPTRVEVWVEKEALAGVIAQTARRHDVAYFACRGYVSQSEQWGAGQRIGQYVRDGQNVVVIHLGDHDPSGIDMTRDIYDRIRRFIGQDYYLALPPDTRSRFSTHGDIWADMQDFLEGREPFEVRRIALNRDQVDEFNPPPNPAKQTDARFAAYEREHGDESWELDALDPATLDALIEGAILAVRDDDAWAELDERESSERAQITALVERWPAVSRMLARKTT